MFTIVGLLLPLAFIAGIAARKPIPTTMLSTDFLQERKAFTKATWDRSDLFPKTALRVQLLCQEATTNRCAIQFSAAKDFVKADLLVYWLPAESTIKDTIPDEVYPPRCIQLGPATTRPFSCRRKAGHNCSIQPR